jgi:hypothetical protein
VIAPSYNVELKVSVKRGTFLQIEQFKYQSILRRVAELQEKE